MRSERTQGTPGAIVVAILLALAIPSPALAQGGDFKEKRFLVRYDSGTANLAPFTALTLYVNPRHVKVLAGQSLVHEIPVGAVTGFTHELRAPFHPGKAMERTFNDTVGACSNLVDCPVLGAAGAVGAAGVGVASLFTPKETVITIRWQEAGRPHIVAMKIAWYQRDFILRALEKATGMRAIEQTYSAAQPGAAPPAAPAPAPSAPGNAAQAAQTASLPSAPPPSESAPELVRRVELVLDRPAFVNGKALDAGFYLVLIQERAAGRVQVVFVDDSVRDASATRIAARAWADVAEDAAATAFEPVFRQDDDGIRLIALRLPGRILKLAE